MLLSLDLINAASKGQKILKGEYEENSQEQKSTKDNIPGRKEKKYHKR